MKTKKISVTYLHPYAVKGQIMKVTNGIRVKFHVPALAEYTRAR